MSDLFKISYGKELGDCTRPYNITLLKECTVREFIDEWLKNNESDWGIFEISYHKTSLAEHLVKRCELYCEYRQGKIIKNPFSDDILDSKIKKVYGSGGWSVSDFTFEIDKIDKRKEIIEMDVNEIKNAKIKSTMLGREDHGIMTFMIFVEFEGCTCGIGGYVLDYYDKTLKTRVHSPKSMEAIAKILEVVGVNNWEDLKGQYIRIKDHGWGSTIDEIGNLMEDKWFNMKEFFSEKLYKL